MLEPFPQSPGLFPTLGGPAAPRDPPARGVSPLLPSDGGPGGFGGRPVTAGTAGGNLSEEDAGMEPHARNLGEIIPSAYMQMRPVCRQERQKVISFPCRALRAGPNLLSSSPLPTDLAF